MTSHTLTWKQKEVADIKELAKKYPVIGLASLTGFPASLFGKTRKSFGKDSVVKVSKLRIIKKALADAGLSNVEKLNENGRRI